LRQPARPRTTPRMHPRTPRFPSGSASGPGMPAVVTPSSTLLALVHLGALLALETPCVLETPCCPRSM
jgi:hypothetical protein